MGKNRKLTDVQRLIDGGMVYCAVRLTMRYRTGFSGDTLVRWRAVPGHRRTYSILIGRPSIRHIALDGLEFEAEAC